MTMMISSYIAKDSFPKFKFCSPDIQLFVYLLLLGEYTLNKGTEEAELCFRGL